MQLFSYNLVSGEDMDVSQLQLKCRKETTHSKLKGGIELNHYGLKVHRLFCERLKVVPVKLQ